MVAPLQGMRSLEQVAEEEAEYSEEARGSPVVNQALDFLAKVSDIG